MTALLKRLLSSRLLGRTDRSQLSGHDVYVRLMRLFLVMIAAAFLLFVVLWPTLREDEVSFTLSKEDITPSDDQIRMVRPRYVGTDAEGRLFRVSAEHGVQSSPEDPRIRLEGIKASIELEPGNTAKLTSKGGTYYIDANVLELDGGMELATTDGYYFSAGATDFDLINQRAVSYNALGGSSPYGSFEAQGFEVDVRAGSVIFVGPVKMRIYPKGARPANPAGRQK